jgi:hypothetical protein
MSPPRLFTLLLLGLSACGPEPATPDGGAPAASTRDRLTAGPRALVFLADQASISLEIRIRRADGWKTYDVAPRLSHGSLSVSAGPDGGIQLGAASLWFDDIAVGDKGVPPTGLHLTDLAVRTRAPHECEWVTWSPDGEACSAGIPATLSLDWSMVMTDGDVYPLATQELAPMDFWVDLARDADGITGDLAVVAPGTLWTWAGIVEFGDLQLSAPAHELIPLADP